VDDYFRYQSDKEANERQYYVVRHGEKLVIPSQDLRVGGARNLFVPIRLSSFIFSDIVWLRENEEIPCDMLVLATPDPAGTCYIQTTNLDGESDLKMRQALPATATMSTERLHRFRVRFSLAERV
jgi:P-type E1-E2 ATPase